MDLLSVSEHALMHSFKNKSYNVNDLNEIKGRGNFSNSDFMPSFKQEFKSFILQPAQKIEKDFSKLHASANDKRKKP